MIKDIKQKIIKTFIFNFKRKKKKNNVFNEKIMQAKKSFFF